jgi:carboxypeptidase C (cathepsin A)
LQNDDKSAKARPKATPSKVARQLNTRKDEFMRKQHVETKRLGQLTAYGAALALAAALSAAQLATPVLAQQTRPAAQQSADAPRPNAAEQGGRAARPQNENSPRLPADAITEHAVELPGRTLHFKATAGSIPLNDAESGNLQAEVAFVAYVLGDASRPVTFLFNGGPGAASAYLNIGAVGPWRLPLDNISASATPPLGPNADTWLDFTDLVFIDPVLTGYSHIVASSDSVRRQLLSVEGDANALAVVIRKWVEKNGRQGAVKFLVGESYGGFRVPKVAHALIDQGVGVRGLIMISPVLDFSNFAQRRHNPMSWVTRLPSMAATVMEATAPFDRNALREVENYAAGDYLRDLMRGERDAEAVERMTPHVAALTGLDPAQVRKLAARIDNGTFQRERNRAHGTVASVYDPTITAFDPSPRAAQSRFSDPVLDAIGPPITAAITALYQGPLKWHVEQPYRLLNGEVNGQWNWGRGRAGPEVVDDLRNALASDRDLQAMVAHGASDLVTPYFGSQLILDQMPVFGSADRLKLTVYGGGHMFYSRDASRRAFREDALALYRATLQKE